MFSLGVLLVHKEEYVMINEKIKLLREKKDWTQQELADKLGVSKSSVSQWENGMKEPRMGMIQKIADLFNVTKSFIIEEEVNDTPYDPDALEILDMLESNKELKMLFMKNKGVITMTINYGKFFKEENEPEYRIKDVRNNDTYFEEDFDNLFKGMLETLKTSKVEILQTLEVDSDEYLDTETELDSEIAELEEMLLSTYHIGQVKTVLNHLFDTFYLEVKTLKN